MPGYKYGMPKKKKAKPMKKKPMKKPMKKPAKIFCTCRIVQRKTNETPALYNAAARLICFSLDDPAGAEYPLGSGFFPFFFLFLTPFKSAPVIFFLGGATAASRFCFLLYLLYGIMTSLIRIFFYLFLVVLS